MKTGQNKSRDPQDRSIADRWRQWFEEVDRLGIPNGKSKDGFRCMESSEL
ncbi:hypothetical protein [Pseudanabaena sp. PCC 6802]|nr:hypothetical protein [Pseudanabaena sp. PCC 6802]